MNTSGASADVPRLAKMIDKLFDHWGLTDQERRALLHSTTTNVESRLASDRDGIDDRELAQRYAQLLYIHKCLRVLFPRNRILAYAWIKTANRAFDDNSPLHMMIYGGTQGLSRVIGYLDCGQHLWPEEFLE